MAITPVTTLVSKAKEQIETLLQEDAEAQVEAGTAQLKWLLTNNSDHAKPK